ncbi:pyrimidine 5'-nucleotidase [Agarivorans sp. MS3-6]|uniref:pyrimidine 5'-nucleotidase n=1 Tax=Agarivorans sp. TSD2052 TaxID=2937286 RepID=UPI00200C31EB|nr:pyrimidine 5'-nucleotidase [Agarivorans sp. TSD2052]UPW17779.1 pyrimidine 5'-nucleotidase [Agarivorans sp. TSD2052]
MRYQWVLFDADETLFDFDAFAGLKLMFSRYNVDFSEQDYHVYQTKNLPLWVDYQAGKISATDLQQQRFSHWARKLNIHPQQLNSAFLSAMAEICRLLPGAKDLVDALLGKVNMGIITNGFTALQTIRLERTGLKDYFFPLVISEQVGVAKPHVAIFEHAFKHMQYPAKDAILMVGDNPHSDIQGGINAGIDTCWLNRHGQAKPEGIEPHHEVSSLKQLQSLLTGV